VHSGEDIERSSSWGTKDLLIVLICFASFALVGMKVALTNPKRQKCTFNAVRHPEFISGSRLSRS